MEMASREPRPPPGGAEGPDRFARVAAAVGVFAFLPAGLWAMVHPRSFFEQVAEFHPYNQHFLQDIGAFQIGLGAVLLIVGLRPRVDALAAGLLGAGIGGTAHAVSHVLGHDLGGKPSLDIPLFAVIGLILLLAGVMRRRTRVRRA